MRLVRSGRPAIATVICVSLLAGCAGGPSATRALEQPADMTAAVQSHIPPGTLIADAQRFMEREGFRCTPTLKGDWGDRTGLRLPVLRPHRWYGFEVGDAEMDDRGRSR
jgi:hypothetical protein